GTENQQLMSEIYAVSQDKDVKRRILQGFMVSADVEHLVQVARAERDPKLRLDAIRMLGVQNRGKTGTVLAELYWAEGQNKDIKREIVNGLFVQGNVTALVAIARKETDPELRKTLVQRLSLMKSKEATDFLMELINK
ncbi:MAG: hypothetical protein AABY89_02505, partial [Acidobacteriota bacterium]